MCQVHSLTLLIDTNDAVSFHVGRDSFVHDVHDACESLHVGHPCHFHTIIGQHGHHEVHGEEYVCLNRILRRHCATLILPVHWRISLQHVVDKRDDAALFFDPLSFVVVNGACGPESLTIAAENHKLSQYDDLKMHKSDGVVHNVRYVDRLLRDIWSELYQEGLAFFADNASAFTSDRHVTSSRVDPWRLPRIVSRAIHIRPLFDLG